jgi:hypothetical protein
MEMKKTRIFLVLILRAVMGIASYAQVSAPTDLTAEAISDHTVCRK